MTGVEHFTCRGVEMLRANFWIPGPTSWFGCMSSANLWIRMHVHGQPLDSDACPRPPPWFGSMSMVNLLFWMHVLLLDTDACPRPPSGFGCMSLANFLIRMPPYLLFMIKFKTGQGMIFLTLVWAGDDSAVAYTNYWWFYRNTPTILFGLRDETRDEVR